MAVGARHSVGVARAAKKLRAHYARTHAVRDVRPRLTTLRTSSLYVLRPHDGGDRAALSALHHNSLPHTPPAAGSDRDVLIKQPFGFILYKTELYR
ncbi:hypothetical protein EVAR_22714_1 [Eumeta japonica]|uniref:Uncharacterized protein n=1 Tax=Eumeta variegata TaxID=151549 RepID=A0A4C1UTM2_EUMVA|nr:hypothetical protein EVAR_22714_1 [Eumeta japonica]